jgi:hypothetical protein
VKEYISYIEYKDIKVIFKILCTFSETYPYLSFQLKLIVVRFYEIHWLCISLLNERNENGGSMQSDSR